MVRKRRFGDYRTNWPCISRWIEDHDVVAVMTLSKTAALRPNSGHSLLAPRPPKADMDLQIN